MKKECLNCGKVIIVKPSHYDRKKFCSRNCKTHYQKLNPPDYWKKMTKKQEIPCTNCGYKLFKKPSVIFKTNFCNMKCKKEYQIKNGHLINQHLKRQVSIKCEICGESFQVPNNRAQTAKYCSKNCLGKANGIRGKIDYTRRVRVFCSDCGKQFEKKPSVIKNLNFCTVECMAVYYSKTGLFSGENSGTWAGGDINYYGPNWLSQRKKARERDKFTCQDCGMTEERYGHELSVHHIIPFRNFNGDWASANEITNLVTICEHPCHRNRHSKHNLVDDIV